MALTPPATLVRPQQVGTNAIVDAHIEPKQEILAQLCVTAMEERELQIISTTIEV